MKYFFLVFFVLIVSSVDILKFQVIEFTVPYSSLIIFAEQGQQYQVSISLSQNDNRMEAFVGCLGLENDLQNIEVLLIFKNTSEISFTIPKNGFYITFVKLTDIYITQQVKLTASLDNIVIKQHFQVIHFQRRNKIGLKIFQLKSQLNNCKLNVSWQGPSTFISFFSKQGNQSKILKSFFIQPNIVKQLVVLKSGTFFVSIEFNQTQVNNNFTRATINLTTGFQNKCQNFCSRAKYPVIGFSPGSSSCLCDYAMFGNFKWNHQLQYCQYLALKSQQEICGDKIKTVSQQCDNGNRPGCRNCSIQKGYDCFINQNYSQEESICQTICGDNYKTDTQECDNGNRPGCKNCSIQRGYNCYLENNTSSTCTSKCGDKIKTDQQECDNGKEIGCLNCKIQTGFVCELKGQTSKCYSVCGDYFKTKDQQCDNGNNVGCKDCKIIPGYQCFIILDQKSYCSSICGDSIKNQDQECDNGGLQGCSSDCRIVKGYNCANLGKASICKKQNGNLIGGLVGGILGLIIVLIIAYFLWKKSKKVSEQTQAKQGPVKRIQSSREIAALDNQIVCSICLSANCTINLPCQHLFHKQCIKSWFEKQIACPLCRRNPIEVIKQKQQSTQKIISLENNN